MESYSMRAIAYTDSGQLDLAILDLTKAIELKPDNPGNYILRASDLRRKGLYQDAANDCIEARKLDPRSVDANIGLGLSLTHQQQFSAAVTAFSQAITLDGTSADAYLFRAEANRSLGANENALSDYTASIKLRPDYAGGYVGRGDLFAKMGEYQLAIKDYNSADEAGTKDARVAYARAWAYLYVGDASAAQRDSDRFIKNSLPTADDHWYAVIVGYLARWKAGTRNEADKFLSAQTAMAAEPNAWLKTIFQHLLGKISATDFLNAATDPGKLTEAHTYIGEILLLSGRSNDSRQHFSWVKDNGTPTFSEYRLATAELGRLQP
jgi:lipoprotein NlpI